MSRRLLYLYNSTYCVLYLRHKMFCIMFCVIKAMWRVISTVKKRPTYTHIQQYMQRQYDLEDVFCSKSVKTVEINSYTFLSEYKGNYFINCLISVSRETMNRTRKLLWGSAALCTAENDERKCISRAREVIPKDFNSNCSNFYALNYSFKGYRSFSVLIYGLLVWHP